MDEKKIDMSSLKINLKGRRMGERGEKPEGQSLKCYLL